MSAVSYQWTAVLKAYTSCISIAYLYIFCIFLLLWIPLYSVGSVHLGDHHVNAAESMRRLYDAALRGISTSLWCFKFKILCWLSHQRQNLTKSNPWGDQLIVTDILLILRAARPSFRCMSLTVIQGHFGSARTGAAHSEQCSILAYTGCSDSLRLWPYALNMVKRGV